MQNNTAKLALLFGIIATIGFGTMNTVSAETSERSGAQGHLELVLRDFDGNIKQYVQTDNLVTNIGLDCIVESVFGTGVTTCVTSTDPFDIIAIGNGTGQSATSIVLNGVMNSGCIALADSSVEFISETSPQSVIIEVQFGGLSSGATLAAFECEYVITESGLFNIGDATTTAVNMLAYQSFSAITIGASDTLTVTWDLDFT